MQEVDLKETDLELIINRNVHSLKQLDLNDISSPTTGGYVAENLNFDKLTKLEKMGISLNSDKIANSLRKTSSAKVFDSTH